MEPEADGKRIKSWLDELGMSGRLIIANEGINGTLSGPANKDQPMRVFIARMESDARFASVDWKLSWAKEQPFNGLLVKLTREIISTGTAQVPPPSEAFEGGKHLSPKEFDAEMKHARERPSSFALLDVRNKHEFAIGHMEGASDPNTRSFSEWFAWAKGNIEELKKKEKVLMYCTGGIRCEKASAFLLSNGCKNVCQLKGGIHRYIEYMKNEEEDKSSWKGKNFVFDGRVVQPEERSTSAVVGTCIECGKPWDKFAGAKVCCVCRDHCLVCDSCSDSLQLVFHCDAHRHLKGSYFFFIDHFSIEELQRQRAELQQVHSNMLKEKEASRNKRRTISRQIQRLSSRLKELESGAHQPAVARPRCRTCGKAYPQECKGECWGIWAKQNEEGSKLIVGRKRLKLATRASAKI